MRSVARIFLSFNLIIIFFFKNLVPFTQKKSYEFISKQKSIEFRFQSLEILEKITNVIRLKGKTLQLTSMLCWAYHSSCLVWISFLPIFWQLLLDQWVWTHRWFPPKWWLLSLPHPRVIPAKTAKVWFARNPVRPGHVMWMTKKHRGLCLKKYKNIECVTINLAFNFDHPKQIFSLSFPLLFTWGGLKYQGFWYVDSILARIDFGVTFGCSQLSDDHLDGNQQQVQNSWSWWSWQKSGWDSIQTKNELWQAEQKIEVCCKVFLSILLNKLAKPSPFYLNENFSYTFIF